jgi:hypothetical protein
MSQRLTMRDAQSWNDAISKGMSLYAGLIFAVLWVGFLIALLANREWLNQVWSVVQALPPVPRLMVWVMLLPIMVGHGSGELHGRLLGD